MRRKSQPPRCHIIGHKQHLVNDGRAPRLAAACASNDTNNATGPSRTQRTAPASHGAPGCAALSCLRKNSTCATIQASDHHPWQATNKRAHLLLQHRDLRAHGAVARRQHQNEKQKQKNSARTCMACRSRFKIGLLLMFLARFAYLLRARPRLIARHGVCAYTLRTSKCSASPRN